LPKPSKVLDNPILTACSAVTAVAAGLNTFVSQFLMPPFWADSVVSILLLTFVINWVGICLNIRKGHHQAGSRAARSFLADAVQPLCVLVLLSILLIWTVYPPLSHLLSVSWRICGTFQTDSPPGSCVVGYDGRGRKISDDCFPLDDAHYVRAMAGSHWWVYRPVKLAIHIGNDEGPKFDVRAEMFSASCKGIQEVP